MGKKTDDGILKFFERDNGFRKDFVSSFFVIDPIEFAQWKKKKNEKNRPWKSKPKTKSRFVERILKDP